MNGPAVVALGDSITAGVGDAVGPDATHGPGWAAHLALLAEAGRFENLARNGARTRTVVDEQLDRALAARPDVATLVIGGNDALRSDFSPADVARRLTTCVGALRGAGAAVVLATLPPVGLFELCGGRVRSVMRTRIDAVNAAVRAVAGRQAGDGTGVVVFDVAEAVRPLGTGAWYVDRVHPSPWGHRHVAVTAARAVRVALPDLARLPAPPPPPPAWERAAWLTLAGVPWALRRGRDFLPGLVRAVLDDLRGAGLGALDLDLELPGLGSRGPAAGTLKEPGEPGLDALVQAT
ncbi:SGNH/GDSL hydrolase family protein [Isoptericola halotolerans]|uniref:Lysophospholipase L1-like esterase n=1 Tax=Isoptericola halotolerans TaxID=300560 RepID=A0ABX2A635_9MICO|nr:SGNH/GDSL hydrolase family protein [Isoptericola halotolerans]NOV97066.1 lysophospholipase L1-like esterase [Isoptericola halotolerans]